jgi:hypothetical protein
MLKGRPHHFPARLLQASTAYLMYRDEELCEALRLYTRDTGETMTVSRLTGMDRMGSSPSGGSPADDLCR